MACVCTHVYAVSGVLGSSLVDGYQSFGEACCLFVKMRVCCAGSKESGHETPGRCKEEKSEQGQWVYSARFF
jgi:hypothetical protein